MTLLKRHAYQVLFGISLIALTSLVSWWSVFIRSAIIREYQNHYDSMRINIRNYSFILGHNDFETPEPGPFAEDDRLEIVHCGENAGELSKKLAPFWTEYCIRPRDEFIERIESKYRSLTTMIIGESGLLVVLILVSGVMLVRMIWLEKRALREIQEFWSNVTHEIKTPITGLKAFLETLKKHDLSHEETVPLVDMALRQIERQEQLAENILIGRRLIHEKPRMNMTDIEICDYIQRYFAERSFRFTERKVNVEYACMPGTEVKADPDAVRIILDNLTDNALKYGGDKLKLSVTVEAKKDSGIIILKDNGPGFDPGMAKNIFEAYKRLTHELPGGKRGTGMGLHISRKLARKMGGDLKASSEGKGKGARFILYLRLKKKGS